MSTIKTIHGPRGLRVEFLDDMYTPVMVFLGRLSATFQCASAEGEIEGQDLSRDQLNFLAELESEADAHYDKYTHNNPENKR